MNSTSPRSRSRALAVASTLVLLTLSELPAQTATAPARPDGDADETVLLSPFVVEGSEDRGSYQATSTLAGTRVRTDLKDIASSLSVVTAEFLRDVGATNNLTLLQYTTNTEVGGVYGNYAGVGTTFINGANESSNFLKPNNNTRVRGLDSADNTRDYFQSDIPWDSFNTGRVDLQRGPNSILFGIGSPAGIVNASINSAGFDNIAAVENRVGSYGTVRWSVDINHVLLKNQLSFRLAALDDRTQYQQEPAFNHDRRLFGAVRWDPHLFNRDSAHTSIRVNFERGYVNANRPRVLPPEDRVTPFFDPHSLDRQAWDAWYAWTYGILPQDSNHFTDIGLPKNYWVGQFAGPGVSMAEPPLFVFDNTTTQGGSPIAIRQGQLSTHFGLNSSGQVDGSFGGANFANSIGIVGYSAFAQNVHRYNPSQYPAADSGFYKDRSMGDPSIFDFYNHLIDGPNKREWQDWTAYNVALEQSLFHQRLGIQLVYDRQKYRDGQERNLNTPFISVDINATLMNYPWGFTAANGYAAPYLSVANPNAGRAFVGGNGNAGNGGTISDRENFRTTLTGELRAGDFLRPSWLTSLLGRHVLTGLYSRETYRVETRNWARYAADPSWSDKIGTGPGGTDTGGLDNGDRIPEWVSYLSAPLFGVTTAAGLHLPPITTTQAPSGQVSILYGDSHWKWPSDPNAATYVDPAAPWTPPNSDPRAPALAPTTQSENPVNYVGPVTGTFNILNADRGDRDQLTIAASKVQKRTTSKGATWQAYLWDDTLVGTIGWRRDRQEQRSGASAYNRRLGYAPLDYGLAPLDASGIANGESVTWGVVLHTPKALRQRLPGGSGVSLFYDVGKNTRVENRYGFDGRSLPNAKGRTVDYGVVLSTLDDRLQLKATFYKTTVTDANISSVSTQATTLGANTMYLYALEAWGTASALTDVAGMAGNPVAPSWYWNWAYVDHNFDAAYDSLDSELYKNSPITAREREVVASWLAQMQPQSWYDAFGYQVNVAKAQAGDFANAVAAWSPTGNIGSIQPSGAGKVNGSWPTGTVDNESKGVELELTGQPLRNWNLSVNASKTQASQTALGAGLVRFIEAQHQKFLSPAGDLRLWWGGDQTVRQYYDQNIWGAYQFQLQTNGKMVPEMAPWRFNAVTNYTFERGPLHGFNVGGGVRWQQGVILGYGLNADQTNLDVNRPYWGNATHAVDLWLGYTRKLTRRIEWRIQFNVRNLDSKTHLERISIQPDGSPAAFRIVEGQAWTLANTVSF